jgi:Restriction endonuclease
VWRDYEELICAQLRRRADGAARIEFDQRIIGRLSGYLRQVDIVVIGRFPGLVSDTATMAVDCKLWSRKVAIDDVDRFVGFLADVGTDLGLLVTNVGFTEAARARAAGERGMKIDVVRATVIARAFRAYCKQCRQLRMMQERRIVATAHGELTAHGWCAVCGAVLEGDVE